MATLSSLIEGGKSPRDAVAEMLKNNIKSVYGGEAEKRGLPNLKDTPTSVAELTSKKNVDLFGKHKVFSAKEVEARQEIMYESYANILTIEAKSMVHMMES